MRVFSFFVRPPAGAGMRTLLSAYITAIGLGYGLIALQAGRLTTSYQIQASYAPIWVYALALTLGGAGLGLSRRRRRTWWARAIAGAVLVLLAFIIGTWIQAHAWTGALGYIVLIWACLMEIAFVEEY